MECVTEVVKGVNTHVVEPASMLVKVVNTHVREAVKIPADRFLGMRGCQNTKTVFFESELFVLLG